MMRVDMLEGQSEEEEEEEESGRERTRVGETRGGEGMSRGWTCRGSEVVRCCEWAAGTV